VLDQLNRRREQLGMRVLKATQANLRPIRGRLRDGLEGRDLALAAYGASLDSWVMEHLKLVPSHVYRAANVEQYIDAARAADPKGNGRPQRQATTRVESLLCDSCGRHWAQQLAADAPAPASFTCAACKDVAQLTRKRQRGEGGLEQVQA
jgi:hypothetical protein